MTRRNTSLQSGDVGWRPTYNFHTMRVNKGTENHAFGLSGLAMVAEIGEGYKTATHQRDRVTTIWQTEMSLVSGWDKRNWQVDEVICDWNTVIKDEQDFREPRQFVIEELVTYKDSGTQKLRIYPGNIKTIGSATSLMGSYKREEKLGIKSSWCRITHITSDLSPAMSCIRQQNGTFLTSPNVRKKIARKLSNQGSGYFFMGNSAQYLPAHMPPLTDIERTSLRWPAGEDTEILDDHLNYYVRSLDDDRPGTKVIKSEVDVYEPGFTISNYGDAFMHGNGALPPSNHYTVLPARRKELKLGSTPIQTLSYASVASGASEQSFKSRKELLRSIPANTGSSSFERQNQATTSLSGFKNLAGQFPASQKISSLDPHTANLLHLLRKSEAQDDMALTQRGRSSTPMGALQTPWTMDPSQTIALAERVDDALDSKGLPPLTAKERESLGLCPENLHIFASTYSDHMKRTGANA